MKKHILYNFSAIISLQSSWRYSWIETFSNKKANNTLSSLRVLYWTYRAPRGSDKYSTQLMQWLPNCRQVEGVLVLRPRHHSPSIFGFAECLAKSLAKHSGPRRLEAWVQSESSGWLDIVQTFLFLYPASSADALIFFIDFQDSCSKGRREKH